MDPITLTTQRLTLRPWVEADRGPFAALGADPAVMKHFPAVLTRRESDAFVDQIVANMVRDGHGFWAVEVRDGAPFIGLVGVSSARPVLGYDVLEVGWRLASDTWGKGYAPEAAYESLRYAFDDRHESEVVAFTVPRNTNSRRVMEKIGMTYVRDFDHPGLPAGHPLRRHVLYRITAEDWRLLTETSTF